MTSEYSLTRPDADAIIADADLAHLEESDRRTVRDMLMSYSDAQAQDFSDRLADADANAQDAAELRDEARDLAAEYAREAHDVLFGFRYGTATVDDLLNTLRRVAEGPRILELDPMEHLGASYFPVPA